MESRFKVSREWVCNLKHNKRINQLIMFAITSISDCHSTYVSDSIITHTSHCNWHELMDMKETSASFICCPSLKWYDDIIHSLFRMNIKFEWRSTFCGQDWTQVPPMALFPMLHNCYDDTLLRCIVISSSYHQSPTVFVIIAVTVGYWLKSQQTIVGVVIVFVGCL